MVAIAIVSALLTSGGCATHNTVRKGEQAVRHANWDAAVYYYLEALAKDPENLKHQMALIRARQKAGQEHFKRGASFRDLGRLVEAENELSMAVQLDPTHQFAVQVLEKVRADLEVLAQPDGAQTLEEMKLKARDAKVKPPVLDPSSNEPITLRFPKPKPVKEIYKALAKAYGFNVLFDPKLKDNDLSVELNDVTAERALEIVMQAAGHFYKVLDEHSLIVVEDNPQNRREYEDLVIKTFFLSNADVKEVDKLLRSLIEARRLATNEQLNAITLRDTADKVAIAEKLISVNDKAKAEVLVSVELLEANTSNLQQIGAKLSTQTFSLAADLDRVSDDHPDGALFLPDIKNISRSAWSLTIPSVVINLVKSSSEATSLAQPQMRITEGEKGALVIGNRIPIPVTTFNTSNSVGSNVVPLTSFQYQDVGIKIDVEPRVHHNREVTLKVTVEVSQVTGTVTQNNQEQPIIGTRSINTVIRLKEGETNMLVGLYKEDSSIGKTELPLLSKIPLLGRLFTDKSTDVTTTDLVLTLTPHILRFPDIQESDLAPLWVGTESRISYFGATSPRVASGSADQGPFDEEPAQRTIRRPEPGEAAYGTAASRRSGAAIRRPGDEAGGGGDQPPPGVDLVPAGSGKSSFLDGPGDDESEPVEVAPGDAMLAPVELGLNPSVLSLSPGESTEIELFTVGGWGSFRLPLSLNFNPRRMVVESVRPAGGTGVLDQLLDNDNGFLGLDLVVAQGDDQPQVAVVIVVRALEPGAVPLVFATGNAVAADGSALPVLSQDGAVFITSHDGEVE